MMQAEMKVKVQQTNIVSKDTQQLPLDAFAKKGASVKQITIPKDLDINHLMNPKHSLENHCEICDKIFKSSQSLKTHIYNFHDTSQMRYKCGPCDITFCNKYGLKNHIINIHIKKWREKHVCETCGKTFLTKRWLRKHVIEKHHHLQSEDNYQYAGNLEKDTKDKENITLEECIENSNQDGLCTIVIKEGQATMINSERICELCFEEFDSESDLDIHQEMEHSEFKFKKKKCNICFKRFKNKKTLAGHLSSQHSVQHIKKTINCFAEGCNESFRVIKEYRHHLINKDDDRHNYKLDLEEKVFQNMGEFLQWKYDLETTHNLRYYKKYERKAKNNSKIQYQCSRSGFQVNNNKTGQRRLKRQGTFKINGVCPSTIEINVNNSGVVNSSYYKNHFGHGTGIDQVMMVNMHERDRRYIREKLLEGVDATQILHELNKMKGRAVYITRKDINNHQSQLRNEISHSLSPCNSTSLDERLPKVDENKLAVANLLKENKGNMHLFSNEDDDGQKLCDPISVHTPLNEHNERKKLIETASSLAENIKKMIDQKINQEPSHSKDNLKEMISLLKKAELTIQANDFKQNANDYIPNKLEKNRNEVLSSNSNSKRHKRQKPQEKTVKRNKL